MLRKGAIALTLVGCAVALTGCVGSPGYALTGVSCQGSNCTAVGSHIYYPCNPPTATCFLYTQTPYSDQWVGATMTSATPPGQFAPIPGRGGALTGVSCTTSACLAVGYTGNCDGAGGCPVGSPGNLATPISDLWAGGSWVEHTPPNKNHTAQLVAVSCPPKGILATCWAVGYYQSGGVDTALIYRWNAGWTVPQVTSPGSFATLSGVSCGAANACEAVGSYVNGSGITVPLAERWNGSSWTMQATPNPGGATSSSLAGVSCVPLGVCTAVGTYTASGGAAKTLAERWDGTAWKIQATPNPGDGGMPALTSVSCGSPGSCMAVGFSPVPLSAQAITSPLTESWTPASGWVIQSAPTVAQQDTELYSVSCTAANACMAVGNTLVGGGTSATLVERWDGVSWTKQ